MLRGTKPEQKEKRLKMFVYGQAGIGKTLQAIQFPNAYIVDTERGTDFYAQTIAKSNSVVFSSSNPDELREELHNLLTTKHEYRTLIIDPITQIYNAIQEKWTRVFEKHAKSDKDAEVQDFGMRYWNKVKSEYKAIERLILALDMNVILTAHQKDVYGTGFTKIGVTFDSMKGDDYLFDLIFRLEKRGDQRIAVTCKERADMGQNKFPAEFEWTYDNFLKFYGAEIIKKEAQVIPMATNEQVEKLNKLLSVVNISEDEQTKWLEKAKVNDFSEFTEEQILKSIAFCETKLKGLTEPKVETKKEKGSK
jgi:hypothetical protein